MAVFAIFHQKGGQGKTQKAINIAHGLSLMGEKNLLVDIDPQNHCSKYLGVSEPSVDDSFDNGDHMLCLYDLVFPDPRRKEKLSDIVIKDVRPNLDLIQNRFYQELSERLVNKRGKTAYLEALKRLDDSYDNIVFDIHPSRDNVNSIALQFSDYLIVPVELKTAAVESFERLFEFLNNIEADNFKKIFVVPNFLDKRKTDRKIYLNQIHEMFSEEDDIVVLPVLPDKSDIEDLVKYGKTMFESDNKDVKELIENIMEQVVNTINEDE